MNDNMQEREMRYPPTESEPLTHPEPVSDYRKAPFLLLKKGVIWLGLLLGVYFVYSTVSIFISPDRRIQQVYLIPGDAVLIIQANNPVSDWKTFSQSTPWQRLKQAPTFAEMAERADYLDSLLQANKTLLSLVGRREMMISVHKTRSSDWDFLMVMDLQKASKLELLKSQIEQIYKIAGQQVTERQYKNFAISELRDPESRDILYTAFVDNHFVASYSTRLIEASIDEREAPRIGREYPFIEAEKLVSGKGLCRMFVNYAYLPQFLTIYMDTRNTYIDPFSRSMSFAGLYSIVEKDRMELKGYSMLREDVDPYVEALFGSGKHKMQAHNIVSARTAVYVNFGFDNVQTFVDRLETAFASNHQSIYESYHTNRQKIEKYFDVSLEENFLGWMSGEFALTQSEPGLLGREPELILAIRAKNIKDARKHMELIEKRIKRRTPVSIKAVKYKGYEINYVELKGFFKLFFGGLFDRFETPFYTFIDDYVVFSNKSASILSFIEDYEQGYTLKKDEGFRRSLNRSHDASTVFAYIDMQKFYGQLPGMLNAETWTAVSAHRDVLYSFPQWTFQLTDEKQKLAIHYVMDYQLYQDLAETEPSAENESEEPTMNEDAETEKELMNELKRFYVEKFEGNVLREFYPSGALQSEAEVKKRQTPRPLPGVLRKRNAETSRKIHQQPPERHLEILHGGWPIRPQGKVLDFAIFAVLQRDGL